MSLNSTKLWPHPDASEDDKISISENLLAQTQELLRDRKKWMETNCLEPGEIWDEDMRTKSEKKESVIIANNLQTKHVRLAIVESAYHNGLYPHIIYNIKLRSQKQYRDPLRGGEILPDVVTDAMLRKLGPLLQIAAAQATTHEYIRFVMQDLVKECTKENTEIPSERGLCEMVMDQYGKELHRVYDQICMGNGLQD